MSSTTLIEVFGHIVFSFTRGVTEHYNPHKNLNTRQSLLASILYKAQVENGIIILLMSLFIKNTATEKPQA